VRLIKKTGCESLTIENTAALGTANGCVAGYKLASWKMDGTVFTPNSTSPYLWRYGTTVKTAAELKATIEIINPLDVYKYVITKSNGQVLTYWNRTVSRPPFYEELTGRQWATFTSSSEALMTTATLYTGGAAPVVAWTTPVGASKPFKVRFYHTSGSDSSNVQPSQLSVSILCTANTECSGSNYVSTLSSNAFSSTANSYQLELLSRARTGTMYSTLVTAK